MEHATLRNTFWTAHDAILELSETAKAEGDPEQAKALRWWAARLRTHKRRLDKKTAALKANQEGRR